MNSRPAFLPLSLFVALVVGCGTPMTVAPVDAGSDGGAGADDAGRDAGPRRLGFAASEDYPAAIAYARGIIRPFAGRRYLYVVGGANATRTTIGPVYSAVMRAEVVGDGTLGPWIPSGDIGDPGAAITLVGHDAIGLTAE